ncbi:hypothetical protein [Priestia megaterium]|uniref:hypothetical protein n=1 Tax=Priestia megaterium TaxID=1404 RepID=UPI001DBE276C|nr:hypothetical protein [Priestia megaterium]CAH0307687.1 hypothetical protein SRABI82_04797 [Priestia megaterium]
MYISKKDDIQDYLIKKGYDVKEFMNENEDWHYFKVSTTWSGVHTVKVKGGFFGYDIQKVK